MTQNLLTRDHYLAVYRLAEQYIRQEMLQAKNIVPSILDKYLQPNYPHGALDLNGLFEHLLHHAKNRSMGGNAVENIFGDSNRSSKKWEKFKEMLGNFDPSYTKYQYNWYKLLETIGRNFTRNAPPTIPVYQYCLTILDGASYFSQFTNGQEFYAKIDKLYSQSLQTPLNEICNITGFGSVLARDFFKELGYDHYIKPDIHIKEICYGLGVATHKDSEDQIADILVIIAKDAGKTPYSLDRMFWLIGSGNFFKVGQEDEQARKIWFRKTQAPERRQNFIDYVNARLSLD